MAYRHVAVTTANGSKLQLEINFRSTGHIEVIYYRAPKTIGFKWSGKYIECYQSDWEENQDEIFTEFAYAGIHVGFYERYHTVVVTVEGTYRKIVPSHLSIEIEKNVDGSHDDFQETFSS